MNERSEQLSTIVSDGLYGFYQSVRGKTEALSEPLSDADATVQSMPDASPAKWHLAHTSWFFEVMVLEPNLRGYRRFDQHFNHLFNSYYETIGDRHPRPKRGVLTRPSLERVRAYRQHVDDGIAALMRTAPDAQIRDVILLGCHHEQQHQELLLTDILHLFAQNPLQPAYRDPTPVEVELQPAVSERFSTFDGGIVELGHLGDGFAFDCESPRHEVLIAPYRLATHLVTNAQWMDFIADGGYSNPLLWLSEGWAMALAERWRHPLYWHFRDNEAWSMTLRGPQPVDPAAPVVNVSYFEADAFATWAGRRLPTEVEWEVAARELPVVGNLLDTDRLRPKPASGKIEGLQQMFGDVWEWTRSAFLPYPRFRPPAGAVGEYNGKFMSGQFVLRGGSCITAATHIRASYRNFFPGHARWQFSGLRLAGDE